MSNVEFNSTDQTIDDADEYSRGISDQLRSDTESKYLRIYCFSCHRREYHYNAMKGRSFHYLLVGFTFGLIILFGPYRCRCCGHRRMCRYDFLNPIYYFHRRKYLRPTRPTSSSNARPSAQDVRPDSPSNETSASDKRTRPRSRSKNGSGDVASAGSERDGENDGAGAGETRRRRRRRSRVRKLKAVKHLDLIGEEKRRQREEQAVQQLTSGDMDFSIDGMVQSFETDESRRLARELELRNRQPLIVRKAKSGKKSKRKLKRRFARKVRLNGPNLYCFNCQQDNQHFHACKGSNYYSFLLGITLGTILILGPYRCSICNKRRLACHDLLNPKYYIRHIIAKRGTGYNA